jgi:hypothetical protein
VVGAAVRTAERPSASPALPDADAARSPRRGWVLWAALALVALQLAVRGWVASVGSFYWDDLILIGRANTSPLLSADLLLQGHDGHFMPGAFLVAGLLTRWAPLEWGPLVVSLLVLQAIASLAVVRLLRVLLGARPVLLLPLLLYLFSPLTLPSFAWWAAALNALPLQAALAWVAADAVRLVRTGRVRHAVSGTLALLLALAFFEKALLVPFVAFAVAWLLGRVEGRPAALRETLRRGAPLWEAAGAVTAFWIWAYLTVADGPSGADGGTAAQAAEMLGRGVSHALVPALLGGPWSWDVLIPSMPWADPPLVLIAGGLAALSAVVWWTLRRRRRTGLVLLLVAGYVAACLVAMVAGRLAPSTPLVLPQTLRYLADASVVVAAAVALVLRAPVRSAPRPPTARRRLALLLATALFLAGSAWSTVGFARLWADYPTAGYLATVRGSLAGASPAPLLDQPVPEVVLGRLTHPDNLAAQVLGPLPDRPPFADATPDLRMIDEGGRLVPARVTEKQTLTPGPQPGCGHFVSTGTVTDAPFEGRLIDWVWTVRLEYLANRDGELQVSLATGRAARTPVHRGLNAVFLRLTGGGDYLRLSTTTPGLSVCATSAVVGEVEPAP